MSIDTHAHPTVGASVYRVVWVPGSDRLLGICHCGVEQDSEDPARLWQWLLAHPDHPAGQDHAEER
jgi:hypothetical protein